MQPSEIWELDADELVWWYERAIWYLRETHGR